MTLSRRRFISITAGTTLGAFGSVNLPAFARPVSWRGIALGAEAKLVIAGLSKSKAENLVGLARNEIERLENIFSIYRSDSALSVLNRTGKLEHPPLELLELFSTVDFIHDASNGLFDPTVQPLWALYAQHKGRPAKHLIGEATGIVGWDGVQTETAHVKFTKPGMAITLNGIAQGYITDRITQILKTNGLSNAIVKMGEISAIGTNPENQPWHVGIAQTGDEKAEEYVDLINQSIATSSLSATTFDGKNGHILYPETGLPARSNWRRVSIIHKSAAIADGLSTAAILMNENQIGEMLKSLAGVKIIAESADKQRIQISS